MPDLFSTGHISRKSPPQNATNLIFEIGRRFLQRVDVPRKNKCRGIKFRLLAIVFTQIFALQLLLEKDAVASRANVIDKDENVALEKWE